MIVLKMTKKQKHILEREKMKKEKMKKEKMTWRTNAKSFYETTLGKIAFLLQKESWFTGTIEYGNTSVQDMVAAWPTKKYNPGSLQIKANHKTKWASIQVCWVERCNGDGKLIYSSYETVLFSPNVPEFKKGSERGRSEPMKINSLYAENTVETIKNMWTQSQPYIEEEIKNDEIKDANLKEAQIKFNAIQEKLQVTLIKNNNWRGDKVVSMCYKASKNYQVSFNEVPKDEDDERTMKTKRNKDEEETLYTIEDFYGKFTAEEIKQIIQIVGGNSRALTEKMLGDK